MKISLEDINNRFIYHAPKPGQPERYAEMREMARLLALHIVSNTPPSRETSLAITHLEDCVFWANASIARHE